MADRGTAPCAVVRFCPEGEWNGRQRSGNLFYYWAMFDPRDHGPKLLGATVLLALLLIESRTAGDLRIFLQASTDLFAGENIHTKLYHEWYHYYYDGFFAVLIHPLTFLPVYWATFVWLVFNTILTFRIGWLVKTMLPTERLGPKGTKLFLILTCVIMFSLWHRNIHLGQMTIFMVYLCLEGYYRIDTGKPVLGGLLLAIGISAKVMPVMLIPYLIYRGYPKGAISALVLTVAILMAPAIFIGVQQNSFLLSERWQLINPTNSEHVLDVDEETFHSITTYLSVLLVKDAGGVYREDLPRHIMDVGMPTLKIAIAVARALLIIAALFFIRALPFQRTTDRLRKFHELSYVLLAIPLIFPHQQHYAFFFALPAIAYLVFHYVLRYTVIAPDEWKKQRSKIIAFAMVVFFLLNSHFILGEFRDLYDHYKTLTYGILLLILALYHARPNVGTRRGTGTTTAVPNIAQ
jgi:hypothetical protein